MNIIALNMMNVIKVRLFEDDIKDVTIGPDAEPESMLSKFQSN